MDPVTNPYVPGAGRRPSALVGRTEAIAAWTTSLARVARGRTDQPMVLYGLRGVGKTVLLTHLRHLAAEQDWLVVQIEAGGGRRLRELVGEGLYEPLADLNRPRAGMRVLKALATALSFKASYDPTGNWNFGVDLTGQAGPSTSGILETDLKKVVKDVSAAAKEGGTGLAVLIDEAQDLEPEELVSLAVVTQAAAQDDWPVLFALAGLPSLPQTLAEAKSYTERFRYHFVERLSTDEARQALAAPAQDEGVVWDDRALDYVVDQSGQYPYFVQQFGADTWLCAPASPIDEPSAREGVAQGLRQLDTGFFRARWDRTTVGEKKYLRAMAPEGETGIASGEVVSRLGKKNTRQLGPTRASLIHKGLIYAPDHGIVAFTVPGMADFIERQPGE